MSLSRPVQPSSNGGEKRSFKKECVVKVRTSNFSKVNIVDLIDAVENVCGEGSCFACIPRSQTHYEVTINNEETSKLLCEGLKIGDDKYMCDRLCETTVVVSFMNLPSYIEDREIIARLNGHGIEVMGEVNRRYYARSKCCDGTRFMRCKFLPNIRSLPYAMKFETVEGMQSFRVIHSDQQRVCWKCYSIDHIITNCPDVRCRVCKRFGHVSYNCKGVPCTICDKCGDECECGSIVQTDNKLDEQICDTPNIVQPHSEQVCC
ncbi:hypothetical protein SNE40_021757 [Patella caerulea]|uniref:CCHC-type domain-containing protein n=1 Tax=Patella caerulea TaxID=87958 RepID=A0AAN8G8D2_PATCE